MRLHLSVITYDINKKAGKHQLWSIMIETPIVELQTHLYIFKSV